MVYLLLDAAVVEESQASNQNHHVEPYRDSYRDTHLDDVTLSLTRRYTLSVVPTMTYSGCSPYSGRIVPTR